MLPRRMTIHASTGKGEVETMERKKKESKEGVEKGIVRTKLMHSLKKKKKGTKFAITALS